MEPNSYFFRTVVPLFPSSLGIRHEDPLLLLGSCFATEMGTRLLNTKFSALVNPFGTIFHPVALAELLHMALHSALPLQNEVVPLESGFAHLRAHSALRGATPVAAQENLALALQNVSAFLPKTRFLSLTFGTALAQHWQSETGFVVANCHKQSAKNFAPRRWSAAAMFEVLQPVLEQLFAKNAPLHLIITVSPVRYLREGFEGNAQSKSALIQLCALLKTAFGDKVSYFPAYEILLDELRDYRWFANDMLHPSEAAADYIFDRFGTIFFDVNTKNMCATFERLLRSCRHRSFDEQSEAHIAFKTKLLAQLEIAQKKYPFIDFSSEINQLQ